jgi:hypothetical protein
MATSKTKGHQQSMTDRNSKLPLRKIVGRVGAAAPRSRCVKPYAVAAAGLAFFALLLVAEGLVLHLKMALGSSLAWAGV